MFIAQVYVATPPKTGTTWLQHVLHVLRVGCALKGAPGWQEQAMAYEDLYEVSPVRLYIEPFKPFTGVFLLTTWTV